MAANPKALPQTNRKTLPKVDPSLHSAARLIVPGPSYPRQAIAAAKAKTHFLQLLDEVERERRPITITKRGRIVAQLVPVMPVVDVAVFDQVFGSMAQSGKITGDIVSPDHQAWGKQWR